MFRDVSVLILAIVAFLSLGGLLVASGCTAKQPKLTEPVRLSDLVSKLKSEINQAQSALSQDSTQANEKPLFILGPVKISLTTVVTKEAGGSIDIKVIPANIESKISTENTQNLEIALKPLEFPPQDNFDIEIIQKRSGAQQSETSSQWDMADIFAIGGAVYVWAKRGSEQILLPAQDITSIHFRPKRMSKTIIDETTQQMMRSA